MSISPETIESYFQQYEWTYTRSGENTWITGVRTSVSSFRIFIRVSEHWIYFVINPFVVCPPDPDDRLRLYYHGLRLNLDMNMAKFGVDSDGDLFLAVELPTENFAYSHFADALNGLSHHAERLYSEIFNMAHNPTFLKGRYDDEMLPDDLSFDDDLADFDDDDLDDLDHRPLDDFGLMDESNDGSGPIIAGKEVRIVDDENGMRIEFETAHDFNDSIDDPADANAADANNTDDDIMNPTNSVDPPSPEDPAQREGEDPEPPSDEPSASVDRNTDDDDDND